MAREFLKAQHCQNPRSLCRRAARNRTASSSRIVEFKKRVPQAIGLIRTGDTTPYANIILESA